MRTSSIITFCISLCFKYSFSSSPLLKNVTDEVFGQANGPETDLGDLLPVAFGDFNSDKYTDIFAVNRERNKIKVLLAEAEKLTGADLSQNTKGFRMSSKHLECTINNVVIEAVIPSDFDGDGGMDVLLVVTNTENDDDHDLSAFVLWGHYDKNQKERRLICHDSTIPEAKSWKWKNNERIKMSAQPIVIMANGDYAADLFGARPKSKSNLEEERGIWIFKPGHENRGQDPQFVPMPNITKGSKNPLIKRPFHSNAFLDFDHDGDADLFVVNENKRIEIWKNLGKGSDDGEEFPFEYKRDVAIPGCEESSYCEMGQAAFADFNMDKREDVIIPVCYDVKCSNQSFLFASVSDLFNKGDFTQINKHTGNRWIFDIPSKTDLEKSNLYTPLTPRVGDINLDGYPDILLRMKDNLLPVPDYKTQLFLNIPWTDTDDSPSPTGRGFMMQEEVMDSVDSTTMATFFDIYEHGMNDIISVQKFKREGSPEVFRIGAFTNSSKSNDAYFSKIIVLTGACYRSTCSDDALGKGNDKVPYGTNIPGQKISYSAKMLQGDVVTPVSTCASQLRQTAHTVLQLPYTIFGLGVSPNFLDKLEVTVTNSTSRSYSSSWSMIIPNSQIYVVPYPPLRENEWQIRLFVTPSHAILITALTLLGICVIITIIIAFLHWRERRQDLKEKLQDTQRFHFDAM